MERGDLGLLENFGEEEVVSVSLSPLELHEDLGLSGWSDARQASSSFILLAMAMLQAEL